MKGPQLNLFINDRENFSHLVGVEEGEKVPQIKSAPRRKTIKFRLKEQLKLCLLVRFNLSERHGEELGRLVLGKRLINGVEALPTNSLSCNQLRLRSHEAKKVFRNFSSREKSLHR